MARRPRPWYRKDKGVWAVIIDGTRHNLGPNKTHAYELFHKLMSAPRPSTKRTPSGSVASILESFLEWVQTHRSSDTYQWYQYRLKRFWLRYPDLLISDLRPFHVQAWVDSYQLSRTSVRNYIRAIKRCLKWARQQGYIDTDPLEHLPAPTADHKEVLITSDEFQTFRSFITDPNFDDLVMITWETGCRPQESLRVEARHVDIINQRWVIPRSEAKVKKHPRVVYCGVSDYLTGFVSLSVSGCWGVPWGWVGA